ncbi:Trimeric GatFAB AmidoTransferase(AdT) complex subunit [Dimargaris xerosporica]|nr:Trimeric GatFAB AmidoTransferase(AdT) complex subunit [Dimargaris xerosporica]
MLTRTFAFGIIGLFLIEHFPTSASTQRSDIFNAFTPTQVALDPDSAYQTAVTQRKVAKTMLPLDNTTIAIKDNICTQRYRTTCCSPLLKDFTSPFDATVVSLLQDAGAWIAGKTNMDEFGMGSTTTFSPFGPTINPAPFLPLGAPSQPLSDTVAQGPHLSAGGSSGGSAASVAAAMCNAALGTDTGGSVRLPASYCGVIGFKPTYGRISRWGVVAYANSLDTVGILALDMPTVKRVYETLNCHDPLDSTNMPETIRQTLHNATHVRTEDAIRRSKWSACNLQGCRVGIPAEYHVNELNEAVVKVWQRAAAHLETLGATVVPISCPHTRYALSAYYILAPAEASSNLARYDGIRYGTPADPTTASDTLYGTTRTQGFGPEVHRRILLGTYVLTSTAYDDYFVQAQKVRRLVQQDFDSAFSLPNVLHSPGQAPLSTTSPSNHPQVDVILTPTAISHAPSLDTARASTASTEASVIMTGYVNDVMTVPASLAGIPAISVPFGHVPSAFQDASGGFLNLPVGMQLLAQYGDDGTLLRVAEALVLAQP